MRSSSGSSSSLDRAAVGRAANTCRSASSWTPGPTARQAREGGSLYSARASPHRDAALPADDVAEELPKIAAALQVSLLFHRAVRHRARAVAVKAVGETRSASLRADVPAPALACSSRTCPVCRSARAAGISPTSISPRTATSAIDIAYMATDIPGNGMELSRIRCW